MRSLTNDCTWPALPFSAQRTIDEMACEMKECQRWHANNEVHTKPAQTLQVACQAKRLQRRRLQYDRELKEDIPESGRARPTAPGRMPAYSSKNFHVSAPSNLRTRTEAISCGSKFPRWTPCLAPGFISIGSQ